MGISLKQMIWVKPLFLFKGLGFLSRQENLLEKYLCFSLSAQQEKLLAVVFITEIQMFV